MEIMLNESIAYNVKSTAYNARTTAYNCKSTAYINGESTAYIKMGKAPRMMLEPLRIMAKAPCMIKAPNKMPFDQFKPAMAIGFP
jgi:hypothetical protein